MSQIIGIDVSHHQKKIDWAKVAASGVKFAIIRAGYGQTGVDSFFEANIKGAIANNIGIGVYWFIYGINENEVMKNADRFIEAIMPYKEYITHKAWCDFEYDTEKNAQTRGKVFSRYERTALIKIFCDTVRRAGFEVGVYANPDYLRNKLGDLSTLPLWLSHYSANKADYECYMWQYTSKGSVAGISGNVDMNILYGEPGTKSEELTDKVNESTKGVNGMDITLQTLKRGAREKQVTMLQRLLKGHGYTLGKVDGIFGTKTEAAVIKFQKENRLDQDGIVGPLTWKELLFN